MKKDICHSVVGVFFMIAVLMTGIQCCYNSEYHELCEEVCHPYKLAAFDARSKVIVCYTENGMVLRPWPAEGGTP